MYRRAYKKDKDSLTGLPIFLLGLLFLLLILPCSFYCYKKIHRFDATMMMMMRMTMMVMIPLHKLLLELVVVVN